MKQSPNTNAPISLQEDIERASPGIQTTDSPLKLKEVLSTTGTSGNFSESLDYCVMPGISFLIDKV